MLKKISFFNVFLFVCCSIWAQSKVDVVGKKFPQIKGASLAGDEVSLPDKTQGKIALITVAFLEEGQAFIDSWAEPFLEKFYQKGGYAYYEVPMINDLPEASQKFIDSGMRAGIEEKMHANVLTFYGDYSVYLKTLNMTNLRSGYAFLLDQNGIIRYHGEGKMTLQDWEKIVAIIHDLNEKTAANE